MKKSTIPREKKSLSIKAVITAFFMVTVNVVTLVISPLLGLGEFNVGYFMIMFVALQIGYMLTLYVRATNAPPIPKKLTQQVSNILMAVSDVVYNFLKDPRKQQQAIPVSHGPSEAEAIARRRIQPEE